MASLLIAAAPASAGVGISVSMTMPAAVAVGQSGLNGSFTVVNTNTVPNQGESNTITQLRLAPSCGTTGTAADPCPLPDPGVFSIGTTATGRAGTACAGRTFSVSAPDANGVVTLTPQGGPVALAPPGGAPGSDRCTVDFTFSVLKVPTIDVDPAAGIQTRVNFRATTQSAQSALSVSAGATLPMTVVRADPTLVAQASRNGNTISGTATLSGPAGAPAPTGTVTFTVYGPNDATCSGPVFATSTNAVSAGSATSNSFPVSQPGTYRFVASYSGDANYLPQTTPCNATGQSVVIVRRPVADFDGNGTTDRSVYRDGAWYVQNQTTVHLGLAGYIPVPADYDGDGDTDRAVYRDGAWYIASQPTTFHGLAGFTPVPGDYDGDGDADRAVYDPSSGAWYIAGQPTVFLGGGADDIPVPGDYDGDGDTDPAVYRNGGWYVHNQATVFHGLAGFIPVPGDYDGDGDTDRAVYNDGAWHVHNQATVFHGLAGDIPVPGDYDGDGDTDRAVYRNGGWYVHNQATAFFGLAGDLPLPLPQAIYRASFGT